MFPVRQPSADYLYRPKAVPRSGFSNPKDFRKPGTYRVDIKINGQILGSAVFQLT